MLLHSGHLDEPGFSRIVDQGRIAAPAEGIAVLELGRGKQQVLLRQSLQHLRIRILDEHTRPGRFLCHVALGIHKLHEGQIIFAAHVRVVLTEGGSDVNHARTIGQRNIGITGYIKRFFMLSFTGFHRAVKQRHILLVFQILALVLFQHLIGRRSRFLICQFSQHRIQQSLRHIIGKAVRRLHLRVGLVRIHAQRHIGRKRPGRGSPCQDISILILHLKAGDGGTFLHILIALRHLMGGKRRSAARAVGHDLEALVKKALIPDFL